MNWEVKKEENGFEIATAISKLRRLYDKFGSTRIVDEMRYDGAFWASVDWRIHELDSKDMIKQLEEWDNE